MTSRENIDICIADIRLRLQAPAEVREQMRYAYADFFVDDGAEPDLTLELQPSPDVYDPIENDRAMLSRDDERLRILARPWCDLDVELKSREGVLRYQRTTYDGAEGWAPPGVRTAIEPLYAHLIARAGGILMHASAVRVGNVGVAFLGKSGAGKTTTAGMFDTAAVLNDELIAITDANRVPRVHGTPFSGMLNDPRPRLAVPLALGMKLVQAPAIQRAPLDPKAAFRLICQCLAIPIGDSETETIGFESAAALAQTTRWERFELTLERSRVRAAVEEAVASY